MAGKSEGTGALYKGKHFSRKDKMRQNDNHITGETWKVIPNTDFAYYSSLGRFCTSHNVDFPYNGAYLCTEDELRSEVNFLANMDNILNEAEGYTNIDYYEQFMQQAQEEGAEKEEDV